MKRVRFADIRGEVVHDVIKGDGGGDGGDGAGTKKNTEDDVGDDRKGKRNGGGGGGVITRVKRSNVIWFYAPPESSSRNKQDARIHRRIEYIGGSTRLGESDGGDDSGEQRNDLKIRSSSGHCSPMYADEETIQQRMKREHHEGRIYLLPAQEQSSVNERIAKPPAAACV
jgi:hypothetical protein